MKRLAWHADVVVIGASAGGPAALRDLLGALPAGFPVPILIALHMPEAFTGPLAERLGQAGPLPVREARDGDRVEGAGVWVAPGGRHLRVRGGPEGPRLTVDLEPPVNSCRPSADVLFRSAADVYGGRTLAVVLTGMGQDGLAGCRELRAAGAKVLVQDRATSVVWGMPGAVAQAGLADAEVPLRDLGAEIARRVGPATVSEPA